MPYYRKLYGAANLDLSRVDLHSINKLSIARKEDYRRTPLRDRTSGTFDLSKCKLVSTSGSTGNPLTILDDPCGLAFEEALSLRDKWAVGVRPLDRVCYVGRHPPPFLEGNSWACKIKGTFYRYQPSNSPISDHMRLYSSWKPNVLIASPWYYRVLTRYVEETGGNLTLDRAISLGELLDDTTRKQITTILAAEVYDIYGMNEVGEIAWECPTRSGYHINAESVTLEFLQNGEPVAAGETGEMHVTCFNRTATPIIRYSTGDMGTSIDDECPCGRGLPLLKGIQGRVMDFIRAKNGRFISPYTMTRSIQGAFGVEQFKVIQKSDYSVEVFIETSETRVKEVLQDVEMRCRKVLSELSINVRLVDNIENEKGPKYRLVESRLTRTRLGWDLNDT